MFIFKNGEFYIGVDIDSGYPYKTTNFTNAKVWNTKEAANNYAKHFKNEPWKLHKVTIICTGDE